MYIRRHLKQEEPIATLETMLFLIDKEIQNKIITLTFCCQSNQSRFIKNVWHLFNNGAGTTR